MKIMRKVKRVIGKFIKKAYKIWYRFVPIDDKLVIFISFHGAGYSDSPKAIYEEMIQDERFKDYRFMWFIKKKFKKRTHIPNAIVKQYFSVQYFFYMARAKYWIVNCKLPMYMEKKKDQIYLQTWHGTPLKRLGCDIEVDENTTFYRSEMSFAKMCETYEVDSRRYTYMISPNHFCTEIFPKAFRVDPNKIVETGYPRNDFITNATSEDVDRIKEKFNLPKDKKIVLYAPTWRDNSYVAKGYTFELKADFYKWREILGDEYVVIFKPHYLIINKYENDENLEGFLYSIPASAEINELYVVSDVLITDYSSVFFDYALLKRPIYFYMYDKEEYQSEMRGFYLDVNKDLPGDIYVDECELMKAIVEDKYDYEKLGAFNERFNHCQDGQCTKRVIDLVFKQVK